jgi:hypothetical protein
MKASLLLESPGRVQPFEVGAGKSVVLGRGRNAQVDTHDSSVSERHLSLSFRDGVLKAEPIPNSGSIRINEVPLSGAQALEVGDEISFGATRVLVLSVGQALARSTRPYLFGYEEALARLRDELTRAKGQRLVGVVLVGVPQLNASARQALTRRVTEETASDVCVGWGEYAPDVLIAIASELLPERWAELRQHIVATAGSRAVVGSAVSPGDGLDAEVLVATAMESLLAPADMPLEPVWVDPVMVRLADVTRRLAERAGVTVFYGPSGAGRRTLARLMADAAGLLPRLVTSIDAAGPGMAVVPPPYSALPEMVRWAQGQGERGAKVALIRDRPLTGGAVQIEVPALVARPADVQPLAESFLAEARGRVGRPRLVLGPEAEMLLAAWRWPGNVCELRNVMVRAARTAVRDEVGRDALPPRLSAEAPLDSLKHSLQAAERELLLEALARTRWNVTAAANRLGQPRRTLVHRLAKLGLKRPTR